MGDTKDEKRKIELPFYCPPKYKVQDYKHRQYKEVHSNP